MKKWNRHSLPHPFRLPLVTKPATQLTLEKRCCKDDLSAVLFIPFKAIWNCPVATAYCIWNKTASLFSSTSYPSEDESLSPLTATEKRTSIARSTAFLFLLLAVDSHPGVATSFSLHVWHPCTLVSVSLISFSNADCNSWRFWIMLHCIPGNFSEKRCSISLGAAFPLKKKRQILKKTSQSRGHC